MDRPATKTIEAIRADLESAMVGMLGESTMTREDQQQNLRRQIERLLPVTVEGFEWSENGNEVTVKIASRIEPFIIGDLKLR